jgi:hypothetical protein
MSGLADLERGRPPIQVFVAVPLGTKVLTDVSL